MNFIQIKRLAKGLTKKALAEKLGVSSTTVTKWESGHMLPGAALIPRLAEALGVTAEELATKISEMMQTQSAA